MVIPAIARGALRGFFLYDVADTIDLANVPKAVRAPVATARLQLRPETASEFIQFTTPPVVVQRPMFQAKIFDYGVISLRFAMPFEGSWASFAETARKMRRDDSLVTASRKELDRLIEDLQTVLDDPHPPLFEDYFIFEVEQFAEPVAASDLTGEFRQDLARVVTGEERQLAVRELDDVFRVSFSYYADDLVVVEWESAFVYDANPGPVADILEFANSQLVELRMYDSVLDRELNRIYESESARVVPWLGRQRYAASAEQLRYLIADIRELLDRSGNALKFIGDAYFARLYRGASARLGIEDWQRQIDVKLRTVGDVYRFAQDRAEHARATVLEIIVILLIVIEVVIGVLTLRHL